MGVSWSSNNSRRRHNYYLNPHPPSQLISSSPYPTPPPYPYPYPAHPLPPPPGPVYHNYAMSQPNFVPYYGYQNMAHMAPPRPPLPPPPPPAYVEHQETKKVQNDVNVHKDTLKLVIDKENPDHRLVSFVFDASFDGSINIIYFAKEAPNCRFDSVFPEVYIPVKVNFQKGLGQRFLQPSGTGVDFDFFDLTELSKPSSENVYPLVISAETVSQKYEDDVSIDPHMQITLAVIEKNEDEGYKARVMKQILWIDGARYELREIYGIGYSNDEINDGESGKECVICMTEPKDTAALPCRHMCMCRDCAKALRVQSNKCPICRQPIEELMEIMVH